MHTSKIQRLTHSHQTTNIELALVTYIWASLYMNKWIYKNCCKEYLGQFRSGRKVFNFSNSSTY